MINPTDLWQAARARSTDQALNTFEVERRATISRLYYAVFHHIQTLPTARSLIQRATFEGGMHRTFITAIRTHSLPHWQRAGRRLHELHGRRLDADYKLTLNIEWQDVQQALHTAETIRKLLGLELT